jgi:cysteine desulfurase
MAHRRIYLDNAASTPLAPEVLEAMQPFLLEQYGNPSSLHRWGMEAREAVERSRTAIAKAIGARPEEIIFTGGGTEADNLAVLGACRRQRGGHVIASAVEHPAVLEPCRALEKRGFKLALLKPDKEGLISPERLKDALTKDTALVSVMAANNEIGTVQQLEELGNLCDDQGVPFHTDAVQALGKLPLDMHKHGPELASFSAQKIHGPKGVGCLYVKAGVKLDPQALGGGQEQGLRSGTENVAGIVGFAKAVELIDIEQDVPRMRRLRDLVIDSLARLPEVRLNGSREQRLCSNTHLSFRGIEGEALVLALSERGIAASTGSACSTRELRPSHVLQAIGLAPDWLHGSIRLSISRYTTEEEVREALPIIAQEIERLRGRRARR